VFDPRPLSESFQRLLRKRVHFKYPGKKHISGFGLPPIMLSLKSKNCSVLLFNELQGYLMTVIEQKAEKFWKNWCGYSCIIMLLCFSGVGRVSRDMQQ